MRSDFAMACELMATEVSTTDIIIFYLYSMGHMMLDGVTDVLKHFQASKLASVALLITSVFLIFAPRYLTDVPGVPEGWNWLPWTVMVFTGVQCAWWATSTAYDAIRSGLQKLHRIWMPVKLKHLSEDERIVLAFAAANEGHFNPRHLDGRDNVPEPIAISLAETSLVRRGLMHHGMMGGSFMSEEGKRLVLAHRSRSN